jgi:hypothetical protein
LAANFISGVSLLLYLISKPGRQLTYKIRITSLK